MNPSKKERMLVAACVYEIGTSAEPADMYQAGYVGLMKARKNFDPSKGFKFCTHAKPWIRGAILDHLRVLDPLTRTQRRQAKAGVVYPKTVRMGGREYRETFPQDYRADYDPPDPHDDFADADTREQLETMFATLDPREAALLRGTLAGRMQKDMAPELGVAAGSVPHILAGAMEKLRRRFAA